MTYKIIDIQGIGPVYAEKLIGFFLNFILFVVKLLHSGYELPHKYTAVSY